MRLRITHAEGVLVVAARASANLLPPHYTRTGRNIRRGGSEISKGWPFARTNRAKTHGLSSHCLRVVRREGRPCRSTTTAALARFASQRPRRSKTRGPDDSERAPTRRRASLSTRIGTWCVVPPCTPQAWMAPDTDAPATTHVRLIPRAIPFSPSFPFADSRQGHAQTQGARRLGGCIPRDADVHRGAHRTPRDFFRTRSRTGAAPKS